MFQNRYKIKIDENKLEYKIYNYEIVLLYSKPTC